MANRRGNGGSSEDFLLGSKITADGDCSHEVRRQLLLGRKAIRNSVLKSKHITLPTKVSIVNATVFPVVTYSCEKNESHSFVSDSL